MEWKGVIGLMSGTSLDGLDCCYVEFSKNEKGYLFRNLQTKSIVYSSEWREKLKNAFYLSPENLAELDKEYGTFLGEQTNLFIKEKDLRKKVIIIASHGHTVFHQPQKGITVQIGSGEKLAEITGINVINDFRILDVQLGGQGAPLVPVGDHYLFHEYAACLNLGGFSNISFVKNGQRIAFDISPCNLPLNIIVTEYFNLEYDENGKLAASGKIIEPLLKSLNEIPFYNLPHPKSLGFEWLTNEFMPIIEKFKDDNPLDLLRTITEHIAIQLAGIINQNQLPDVLITGGGVYNSFLISRLKELTSSKIIIPPKEIIEFKEALIFAFLGYLNLENTINTFKSVTGAKEDSIGGKRHFSHLH